MTTVKTAVQLIVFGERNSSDFEGVLRDVKTAGFDAFESGNLFSSYGEDRTRKILAETGLSVAGAHFGYTEFTSPEQVAVDIAFAKAVGLENIMCSGVAENSIEGYKQSAKVFNEIGKQFSDSGLVFNYHNHNWEFNPLDGTTGMAILAEETDSAYVKFNMDIFWLYYAGQDVVGFITKRADRAGYFHFKDGKSAVDSDGKHRPVFMELGRGEVDIKAAYDAAVKAGAKWITYEQDHSELLPLEATSISRNYLKSALGI